MSIEIKSISTYADYKAAEQIQASVLGFEPLDVVPYQILQSFTQSGGAVIGAFDSGLLVGVVMGYTGLLPDNTPYHRSQRMAVLPAYRGRGIGVALKQAQADVARSHGLQLMCWTYDPLRALNAHLNLHKLGAISRRYLVNAYFGSTSPRDSGAPIDRLWVEWDLTQRAVGDRPAMALSSETAIALRIVADQPSEPDLSLTAPVVVIQVPPNIDAVRELGVDRLMAWRMATRAVFVHYFAAGYIAAEFVRDIGYVLRNA